VSKGKGTANWAQMKQVAAFLAPFEPAARNWIGRTVSCSFQRLTIGGGGEEEW